MTLPPHFTGGMSNKYNKEAMTLCFGIILSEHDEGKEVKGTLQYVSSPKETDSNSTFCDSILDKSKTSLIIVSKVLLL